MLVTTATVSICKDHHLVDHMTPNMLLKRNVDDILCVPGQSEVSILQLKFVS